MEDGDMLVGLLGLVGLVSVEGFVVVVGFVGVLGLVSVKGFVGVVGVGLESPANFAEMKNVRCVRYVGERDHR